MTDDFERMVSDAQADGKITDHDADEARQFADFLLIAGSPTVAGRESPDGKAPIDRLIEAGRRDLIDYALPGASGEAAFWNHVPGDADVVGEPPYNVVQVGIKILNSITPGDGRPQRIVDLGCGFGRLTNAMARRLNAKDSVFGIDISRTLIDRAVIDAKERDLGNVKYWHGDGRNWPAGLSGRFTGAYSVAMFQHIPADAMWGYIRQVHERLEDGGVFMFTIALGETDEFLNHQIDKPEQFANDLMTLFDSVEIDVPIGDEFQMRNEHAWVWVKATKDAG